MKKIISSLVLLSLMAFAVSAATVDYDIDMFRVSDGTYSGEVYSVNTLVDGYLKVVLATNSLQFSGEEDENDNPIPGCSDDYYLLKMYSNGNEITYNNGNYWKLGDAISAGVLKMRQLYLGYGTYSNVKFVFDCPSDDYFDAEAERTVSFTLRPSTYCSVWNRYLGRC